MIPSDQTRFSFADITKILAELPGMNLEAVSSARLYWHQHRREGLDHLTMADYAAWLAGCRGTFPVAIQHPRIILTAADHVIAGQESETPDLIALITAGEAPVCAAAESIDADLRLYELDLDSPLPDNSTGPLMSEEECARLIIYGMMMVEAGPDLLVLAGFGQGAETAAHRLLAKRQGYAVLELLCHTGGREIATMVGSLLAARMARLPVLLEGLSALAAMAVLQRLDSRAVQHAMFVGDNPDWLEQAQQLGLQSANRPSSGLGEGATNLVSDLRMAGGAA